MFLRVLFPALFPPEYSRVVSHGSDSRPLQRIYASASEATADAEVVVLPTWMLVVVVAAVAGAGAAGVG